MLVGIYFFSAFLFYWIVNRPFVKLVCHQDAGWHAYWAASRNKGVDLRQQLNILMGCARIGSMYPYLLWFKLFGIQNPEFISRKVFLVLNCCTSVILFFALRVFIPEQTVLSFLIPFVYLLFSSNPFWGIHYETSERTTNFINAIIFLLVSFFLVIPNGYLLGVVVFLMFLSALFFKVTQLVEYFAIWLFIMIYTWKMIYLPVSMIGAAVALAIFYFFLKSKGLWVRENLGVLGYLSLNYKKPSDTIKDIERKIDTLVSNAALKKVLKLLVNKIEGKRYEKIISNMLVAGGKISYRLRYFGSNIYCSSRSVILWSCLGLFLTPHFRSAEYFAVFWLIGCFINIFLQGKFLPFHYIPSLIPLALLSGLGLYKIWLGATAFSWWSWLFCSLVVIVLYIDLKYILSIFSGNNQSPIDYKLWTNSDREMLEKNFAACEIANYIKENTSEDDYIFVWGCVPQLHVLCQRRSPIGWLNTNDSLMSPTFPEWKKVMLLNLIKTMPKFLIQFEKDLNLTALEEATGLKYKFDRTFFKGKYSIFKLYDIIKVDEYKAENYVDNLYQKIPLCAEYSV